jgi:hypothetical protein
LIVANSKDGIFIRGEDIIPQNLYLRINVILISRIRRICNFIGKYRLNVKDGGNCILVGYWKKSHIVLGAKNSMRDFK